MRVEQTHTLSKFRFTKRNVQIILGSLWILDGLLQLQPKMFTDQFVNQVISKSALNQPYIISKPISIFIHIFLLQPVMFNIIVIITQLLIGYLIINKKTVKIGLTLSILWGLFVFYIGEGAASIFSGHALILMGAPGAAILYSVIAIAVWPKSNDTKSEMPSYWLVFIWSIIWIGGAIYQLLPGQNSVTNLSSMISGNSNGAPAYLTYLDNHLASFINGFGAYAKQMNGIHMNSYQMAHMQTQPDTGFWFIMLIAIIQIFIGVGVLIRGKVRKIAIYIGIIMLLIYWVIGQNLGGYYSGLMTDPNTSPLLILMGLCVFKLNDLDIKIKAFYKRIEKVLI